MENRKVISKCSIPVITEQTTLGELISVLDPVTKTKKTPTSKALRENDGAPIASAERCVAYSNGYAVYDNGIGRTVLWVPDCTSFTYSFNKMKSKERNNEMKESIDLPKELLESQPWSIGITLIGEHRIENLVMRRKSNRKKSRSLIRGDNEEREAMVQMEEQDDLLVKELFLREDQIGEDPEAIYIRKETQRRTLDSMTEKQRQAFILYYKYGYTQQEIADIVMIAQRAVAYRLEGALKHVMHHFK